MMEQKNASDLSASIMDLASQSQDRNEILEEIRDNLEVLTGVIRNGFDLLNHQMDEYFKAMTIYKE
jgi:predicted house-cleaning NTP pyrophosphatase (Maf/HAM1 superfamily)